MAEMSMSILARAEQIELAIPAQLENARDREDDWTGRSDARERRKAQNRLHQRAWRRRKTEAAKVKSGAGVSTPGFVEPEHESVTIAFEQATAAIIERPHRARDSFSEPSIPKQVQKTKPPTGATTTITTSQDVPHTIQEVTPLSIFDLMSVNLSSTPPASSTPSTRIPPTPTTIFPKLIPPVIPSLSSTSAPFILRFPLSPDHHLITLIQYNVFRAILTNLSLCSLLSTIPGSCTNVSLIPLIPTPSSPPSTFRPTATQLCTPHSAWIDSVPCPRLRDNLILGQGRYDEDALCEDVCGGLYEGYDDCEARGWLVWGSPWEIASWEISEGFVERWGWLLEGCEEMWRASDAWRAERGDEPSSRGKNMHGELL